MKQVQVSTSEYESNYRLWLQKELTDRCKKNTAYSLRAFSRLLKLDPSTVSQLLSGKRKPSIKLINYLCDALSASPLTRRSIVQNLSVQETNSLPPQDENFRLLAEDTFAVISEWYHYAILELTVVEGFDNNPQWIARSLGITIHQAKTAIERLLRLSLLQEKNNILTKSDRFVTNFSPGISTPALKELQRGLIQKALTAIDEIPQEEKDITSITFAMDKAKLPEARKKITQFRRQMCVLLESGKRKQVFNLGIQLYPISKINNQIRRK